MQQQQIVSRLGHFTASEIGKLLSEGKMKGQIFGKTALAYIYEKAAEVLTGDRKMQASSFSLEWGKDQEKRAFERFAKEYPDDTIYYGAESFKYFQHPEIELSGGSPDGVTPDAVIEIKCPFNSANHIEALIGVKSEGRNEWLRKYNMEYYAQLQWNMECCKMDLGYFISYDPRITDYEKSIAIVTITKDEALIETLKYRVKEAIKIVSNIIQ